MQNSMHHLIFRDYDIRGIVGKTLFPEDAKNIGMAIATILNKKFSSIDLEKKKHIKICVGYDGRLTSLELANKLIEGIIDYGINVVNIGLVPSPLLYFAGFYYNSDAAIIVTGSHNAPDYNGFKISIENKPFYNDDIQSLKQLIIEKSYQNNGLSAQVNAVSTENIQKIYIENIISKFEFEKNYHPIIVWDPGNGATGNVVAEIIKFLPGKHILINHEIDGRFPSHHPDPTISENLAQLIETILLNNADIGIAFDGDGDRIGIVEKDGKIIFADQLLMIFAFDLLKKHPGAKIIADVKTSDICFNFIRENGGIPIMCKTGHSYIKDKMINENALLASEMSGHIFFKDDYLGFDDAIYAAIRLIYILSKNPYILENIHKKLELFDTGEMRIFCPDEKKFIIIEEIKAQMVLRGEKFCDIDGIRVSEENGWWLIRASNTQPAIIIRAESYDEENYKKICFKIDSLISNYGIKTNLEEIL